MNRLTNAFSSAIPSSGSDASSIHLRERDSPRVSSPLDPSFNLQPHAHPHRPSQTQEQRRHLQNLIYDDPRTIYHPSPSPSSSDRGFMSNLGLLTAGINRPGRPGILRHMTDDGSGRSTPRVRSESRSRERDRAVRVNLMSTGAQGGKRGWGMNSASGNTRLNAMAQGPEGRYAIGGGQYLRVMKIHDPNSGSTTPIFASDETKDRSTLAKGSGGVTISEVVNLWKPNWPVGKGVNDIDWGVGAFDSKIVTATPSGNLMLFDVDKGRLDKDISSGTFRPMNCVRLCSSPSHGHLALTGGTEGGVRFWDLRERDPSNRKALKHSSPVTSITFCPTDAYQFVTGLEDGSIRRYDFRSPQRSIGKAFGAHGSKSVLDLKWKEGDEESDGTRGGGWLASAGADKIVQIWDMNQQWDKPPSPVHSLHTSHPVRKISWRPDHPTELVVVPLIQTLTAADPTLAANAGSATPASDSIPHEHQDEDAHLEIWHVRRHYIAKYSIPSQDGVAVDVTWSNGDNNLVACFQNGGFAQMDVKGKSGVSSLPLPLDQVPRQLIGWSPRGELAYALDKFRLGEIPFDDVKPEYVNHWDKLGRPAPAPSISDPPYEPLQTIGFLPVPDTDESEFAYLANWYKIEGDSPERLCRWNGDVAVSCGRDDDARLWNFLKDLIEEFDPSPELTGEAGFREDIFSGTLDSTARLPTPPNLSPRHDSPDPNPKLNVPYPSPTPIPLTRVDSAFFHTEDELSGSSSSTSSDNSYSDSESEDEHKSRSRFMAFAPPEILSPDLNSRKDSGGTVIVPRSTSNAIKNMKFTSTATTGTSTPRSRSSSSGSPPPPGEKGSLSTSTSKKSSLSKMTSSRIMAMSDWPDPYGIQAIPDYSNTPTTTANTPALNSVSRTSPTPLDSSRVIRSSPLPFSSLRKGSTPDEHSRKNSKDTNNQSISVTKTPITTVIKADEDKFSEHDWAEYKKRRLEALKGWWAGCVDDGEMQLATTIAIVGSAVGTFPLRQVERLTHSYVDMLERHRLPLPASYIRLYSNIPSLQIVPINEGITHKLHCGRCGKSTGELDDIGVEGKVFWWCKRCKLGAKVCAVCRKVVKGLWLGCRKCGHGGHGTCMRVYHNQAPLQPLAQANLHRDVDANTSLTRTYTGMHTTTTDHSGAAEDMSVSHTHEEGGWSVCPSGCGCKCRRV
ncbi:uncharacterized protein I303_108557 [Kwoniella dejecticola CBS 10117]|uniref:Uncharacterized protein n=1 Tax=Kwoniella dejecticola CBS 10117 TaxID=1296121 RepID=A0A1A5ZX27_9TREE|nr:uncharacterized protein I303_07118 [Kwoniella dejecticola CBS 10117]OBR82359.1 hypothetical protein I303_07118 [Kwoniella dejecticola CBS 10117]